MEKLLVFAFLMLALPSSGMVSGAPTAPSPPSPRPSLHQISEANSDFSLRLYKQIAARSPTASQNIFFSPLSISAALNLLALGARDNTRAQILQVLGYGNITDAVTVGEIFRDLLEHVDNQDRRIKTGKALYVQKGLEIREKFRREVKELYDAKTETVDFHEQQRTKDKINAYVSNKTEGRITDYLTKPPSKDTLVLLLNYILYRGKWSRPFNANCTYETDFHIDSHRTVRVQMMKQKGLHYVTHARDLSSDVLLLELERNTSLLLLLPTPGKLSELEQKLTVQKFYQLLLSMQKHSVDVHLPRITLKDGYELKTILSDMGIKDAFNRKANFSGISEHPIAVSEVIQKAVLEVDEKGVTGSASTKVEIKPLSRPWSIKFNRPFLLLIADNDSRSVLFAGRVANPVA